MGKKAIIAGYDDNTYFLNQNNEVYRNSNTGVVILGKYLGDDTNGKSFDKKTFKIFLVLLGAIVGGIFTLIAAYLTILAIPADSGEAKAICTVENSFIHGLFVCGDYYQILEDNEPDDTPTETPERNGTKKQDIDNILGEGNWFCFPTIRNAVGIRNLDATLVEVNLNSLPTPFYDLHEDGMGAATGWIRPAFATHDECPESQHELIAAWQAAATTATSDASDLNNIFSAGNWRCDAGGIAVGSIPQSLPTVWYPFISADSHGTKYAIGESVPVGQGAIFWLAQPCN
jgi:hypothetical protein